ncbi:carbohydrate ABC transporter permease [Brucella thiophenivorans]|uniref:Binding-protein-dependent transport system inner membrane component family protein n=1 Tax=Brucella thiophenivorans TaxID=571255 RepID=A0A256FEP3_9HYPH|nr:sugar ABC transporter permease [Brucella thiophenivorans]OYR13347.1 binding-protein-dependent transport system inner membrane component family protein [Brucella thiophenivorans]
MSEAIRDASAGHTRLTFASQQSKFFWALLTPVLVVLGVVTLLPTIYLLITSFTPLSLATPGTAWNFSKPFANYSLLLSDARLHNSLWVQAKLSFFTVALQLGLGLTIAILLNMRTPLMNALRTSFLIPMVLPPIIVAIIWKVLYSPDISPAWWLFDAMGWVVISPITDANWALTAIIIADTWEWFPFTMLIILAALSQFPEEQREAARIDGATSWQVTLYITLPYLKNTLLVAGLFRLIDSIKTFPLIYILTDGGPGTVTEVSNYYIFSQSFNYSYIGYSSAVTMVLVAIVLVLSWITIRLVSGDQKNG